MALRKGHHSRHVICCPSVKLRTTLDTTTVRGDLEYSSYLDIVIILFNRCLQCLAKERISVVARLQNHERADISRGLPQVRPFSTNCPKCGAYRVLDLSEEKDQGDIAISFSLLIYQCDEAKPVCSRCVKANRDCFYGQKAIIDSRLGFTESEMPYT